MDPVRRELASYRIRVGAIQAVVTCGPEPSSLRNLSMNSRSLSDMDSPVRRPVNRSD
jgi:hypothetical protein